MLIVLFLSCLQSISSLICQHCGGQIYSAGLRLSRDACCHPSYAHCKGKEVCIRALVTSPHSRFFLSGCHPPEDGLIGCDTHPLPLNASVHRCICMDSKCQEYFPGQCARTTSVSSQWMVTSTIKQVATSRPRPPTAEPVTSTPAAVPSSDRLMDLTADRTSASLSISIVLIIMLCCCYYL